VGVALPEGDHAATGARLKRRYPQAQALPPPSPLAEVVAAIVALTDGEARDLSFAPLDRRGQAPFNLEVYDLALGIGPGETSTYGDIARRLGDVALSRAVGQALGANPWPIIVPCHRVLAADGRAGGFSGPGGITTKLRLLTIERASASGEPGLFAALPFAARPASA
jgi:methylated-DNA-[protein]-cysteine S-methyltransferase